MYIYDCYSTTEIVYANVKIAERENFSSKIKFHTSSNQ
jgi:hypothetical protein